MSDKRLRALERLFQATGDPLFLRELRRLGMLADLDNPRLLAARLAEIDGELALTEDDWPWAIENVRPLAALIRGEVAAARQVSAQANTPAPPAQPTRPSGYAYPPGFRFRTPEELEEYWRRLFPGLDASHVRTLVADLRRPHLGWAQAIGMIPKPRRIHRASEAKRLEQIFQIIADQQPFHNYRAGQLGPQRMRLLASTREWRDELERSQPGDFLVFAYQFGERHAGYSVRDARTRILGEQGVPLDAYSNACLLAAHPDRIPGPGRWYLDCAGNEYRERNGLMLSALYFDWYALRLAFDDRYADSVNSGAGASSVLV